MLGHCFLCIESKTVDKRQKRTKKHTTTCKLLDFFSAKQKNIFSHTAMTPELNLGVLKGCALWQLPLSLPLCTQCLFTCTCLYTLVLHSDSSSCLSAFSFPPTSDPAASTLHSLFILCYHLDLPLPLCCHS